MHTHSRASAQALSTYLFNRILITFILAVAFFIIFSSTAFAETTWRYTFNSDGTLMETGSLTTSSSPYFWLNSGGKFLIKGGVGMTVQNSLVSNDGIRLLYASANPLDTTNGYYPQNLLRLITKASWGNVDETLKFKINKTNLTDTPNRDSYSGVFLMGRYLDQHNLYYVGIREDGLAVIKKKINGTYYTLAQKQIFGTQSDYDKWSNPNLLPQGTWMGIRARFENLLDGSVRVSMYLDAHNTGTFSNILSAVDAGTGGAALTGSGRGGVRSDYMDMEFDDLEFRTF